MDSAKSVEFANSNTPWPLPRIFPYPTFERWALDIVTFARPPATARYQCSYRCNSIGV